MICRIKRFIDKRFKLTLFISLTNFAITCIGVIYSQYIVPAAVAFALSFLFVFRLFLSRIGHIPIFMSDKMWDFLYRRKSLTTYESKDAKYKDMSLTIAAVCMPLSSISVAVYLLFEIIGAIGML